MNEKIYFPGLNALRFFSALAVIITHIELLKHKFELPNYWHIEIIEKLGVIGVSFFFVLSGFLITYLMMEEQENTSLFSIKNFYIRRVLRIWPLYFLILFFGFFILPNFTYLQYFSDNFKLYFTENLICYLLILPNVSSSFFSTVPLIGQLWSIGIEEQFYLFWPLFFKFFKKFSFKILLYLLGAIVLVKLIVLVLSDFYLLNNLKNFFSMMKFENMIVGALGALILKNNISKSLNLIYNPFVFFSSIVGIFLSIYITPDLLKDGLHIIHSIFFIIIILNISTNKKYFSILENKYLYLLGTISYGINMYHMIVIYFVIKFITDYDFLDINSFYGFLYLYGSTISITILISYFSYYYFEIKFLNLKSSLINSFKP